jgi:hypothetical protein
VWWKQQLQREYCPLVPGNLLDLVTRAFTLVQVGGVTGIGPECGRNFERVFYSLCSSLSIHLAEEAGARTLAETRAASGICHEVDGATRAVDCVTIWEMKYLSGKVPKNEFIIFNGKALDFFQGSKPLFARVPLHRLFLTGSNVRDDCRYYAALWGIMIIEPDRLPLPMLYEAVGRGASGALSDADCRAVRERVPWACRSLQKVIGELGSWSTGESNTGICGPGALRVAKEVVDIQEQIGRSVLDFLDEECPDWIDDTAEHTWQSTGGW